jgi:hypothetical protein
MTHLRQSLDFSIEIDKEVQKGASGTIVGSEEVCTQAQQSEGQCHCPMTEYTKKYLHAQFLEQGCKQ